jgi:DNA-binding NtrC family response regulator
MMKEATILLVDDEVVFTNNMSKLLTKRGYRVTTVNSGEEALRALQESALILTGHGSIDTALEAIRLGAYDYVTKPCEIGDLVSKIEAASERKTIRDKRGS